MLVCDFLRKFDIDSLYICPPYLYTVATLPWEIQKGIFQQLFHIYFRLLALSQKKTNYNCCTAICLLTVVYVLPIMCVAIFYRQFFLSLWSVILRATNANPQPTLFRVTNIWRNATLPSVRCNSFTFYKVVR